MSIVRFSEKYNDWLLRLEEFLPAEYLSERLSCIESLSCKQMLSRYALVRARPVLISRKPLPAVLRSIIARICVAANEHDVAVYSEEYSKHFHEGQS